MNFCCWKIKNWLRYFLFSTLLFSILLASYLFHIFPLNSLIPPLLLPWPYVRVTWVVQKIKSITPKKPQNYNNVGASTCSMIFPSKLQWLWKCLQMSGEEFKLLKPLQKQHNIPYPVTFSRLWQWSLSRGFQSHLCVDCHKAIENEAWCSSLVESIPLYL